MDTAEAFEAAVHRHDQRISALGLNIWVGSEPTFTDRLAQTPEWLHPALGVQVPVRLILHHPDLPDCQEATLHEWRPDGAAYAGLPADMAEADARRRQRITLRRLPQGSVTTAQREAVAGLGPYFLDLRRLIARGSTG